MALQQNAIVMVCCCCYSYVTVVFSLPNIKVLQAIGILLSNIGGSFLRKKRSPTQHWMPDEFYYIQFLRVVTLCFHTCRYPPASPLALPPSLPPANKSSSAAMMKWPPANMTRNVACLVQKYHFDQYLLHIYILHIYIYLFFLHDWESVLTITYIQ